MVKELDIRDWTPSEIADMIDGEISGLLPAQKKLDQSLTAHYHTIDYGEDDDDHNSPFYDFSSCSSSQVSVLGLITPERTESNRRDCHLLQGIDLTSLFLLLDQRFTILCFSRWVCHSKRKNMRCNSLRTNYNWREEDMVVWYNTVLSCRWQVWWQQFSELRKVFQLELLLWGWIWSSD